MHIAAFFDIDGTLYRDSLMIEHFKKLVKYEVIDPALWHAHVKHTHSEWSKRQGEYDDYMEELAQIYINALKGLNMKKMEFITEQVIKLQGDIVYAFARDQIAWHKANNHKIFFISGSPDHLVSKMAEKYGVSDFKGTLYKTDEEGLFTGEVVPMWDSDSKNKAIREFVHKYSIDLDYSYAYGDTKGDLSMLKLVGHPVAINPTRELVECIRENAALRAKAKIIVERKDNIYELSPDVSIISSR